MGKMNAVVRMLGMVAILGISSVWAGKGKPMDNEVVKPFGEFFPIVSGGLAQATVALPADYRIQKLPDDLALNNFLWGREGDLRAVLAKPDEVAFDKAKHGMFHVRFSKNVTYDSGSRQFVDANGPVNADKMGVQGTSTLLRVGDVPGLAIAGTMKGKPIRLVYLYSPADNLAAFITFRSPDPTVSPEKDVWESFIKNLSRIRR
jgi:hypothetical protein